MILTTTIWLLLCLAEVGFYAYAIHMQQVNKKWKLLIGGIEAGIIGAAILLGLLKWDTGFKALFFILLVRLVVIFLFYRKDAKKKTSSMVLKLVGSIVILSMACVPSWIFPQYKELPVSGPHSIDTVSFIWTDESRIETFETDGSKREITAQFWYPSDAKEGETFPLVIFSHGAFGYRMSNYSTYTELASNGYIVCSLDHPYHSFFTKDSTGKTITVNPQFIQSVIGINAEGIAEEEIFKQSREWNNLRVDDMNFAIDTIKELATFVQQGNDTAELTETDKKNLFSKINYEKIGVMGHSLGGSAAVTLGRERDDIGAVIDLDGTMLGEEADFQEGRYIYFEGAYPTPLLMLETESHYREARTLDSLYVNNYVIDHAVDSTEVYFKEAEHLDFTDLPMFSPILASLLGKGKIDSKYCITTMNQLVLEYFNQYLKDGSKCQFKECY